MTSERPEDSPAGLDEDELVADAHARIEDAEEEFGPEAPPRGSLTRPRGTDSVE
jgi:hypothetical protein